MIKNPSCAKTVRLTAPVSYVKKGTKPDYMLVGIGRGWAWHRGQSPKVVHSLLNFEDLIGFGSKDLHDAPASAARKPFGRTSGFAAGSDFLPPCFMPEVGLITYELCVSLRVPEFQLSLTS